MLPSTRSNSGPVGLFAALVLAKRGVRVRIVDKEWQTGTHSYALALHAGSLALLDAVGLKDRVLEAAYRIRTVALYDGAERKVAVPLSVLRTDTPFVAVVRQDVLETLLETLFHPFLETLLNSYPFHTGNISHFLFLLILTEPFTKFIAQLWRQDH